MSDVLGYKPDKRTSFAVRKQFKIISRLLSTIDDHFNFLSEELGRFQKEATYEGSSLLNAENLPRVLAEFELTCAQREIDGLLKVLNSRGVPTVADFRRIATDERIARIAEIYLQELETDPGTFDIVSLLANLASVDGRDVQEERRLVLTQIATFRGWEERRNSRRDDG